MRSGARLPAVAALCASLACVPAVAQRTQKPPLHGQEWMAVTGKPLGAAAGAKVFLKGGNAVAAIMAQALVWDPHARKVTGVNALGVAPTGATAEFFRSKGMDHPPPYGPLAAVTPGTPGGIMTMLAEWGRLPLAEVLEPAIRLADGYPIEAQTASYIERQRDRLLQWPDSKRIMLPREGHHAPEAGEIFRQPELAATLRKLVEAEKAALAAGKTRKEAILAAQDRFYRGDIARALVASVRAQGGLFTEADLANWRVRLEEPVSTSYRGREVFKLTAWTQGPVMLQALNILENFDLKAMGYNSARYIHTVYQAMNLAYADRDFYYGDVYAPPEEPVAGLLSKDYARERAKLVDPRRNDAKTAPGNPYRFQGGANPYLDLLERWHEPRRKGPSTGGTPMAANDAAFEAAFYAGTTSVIAADKEGWVVSVTPSGGWVPAVIAGETGIGLSQRMQSFVTDPAENPFNVVGPGRQPRVTLTPSLALKDGRPWLAFAVQGGDGQDQDLLQYFLNVAEFGMTPQEAAEAPGFNSFQMRASFEAHESRPGRILLNDATPAWVRKELKAMGYDAVFRDRTSGPVNAILLDPRHGTFWGASSNHGEDYGIGW